MSETGEKVTFTMVFEVDKTIFKSMNPFTTETPWGLPYAAGVGDAFKENDELRELLDKTKE